MDMKSKRLFIGALPYKFKEGELLRLFVKVGKVVDVRIIFNKWGKSRGMAYVEFENVEDAVKAKNKYHRFEIEEGRRIIVDYAKIDPLSTEEGQRNKRQAIERRKIRKNGKKKIKNPIRQTVWNQRKYGSKIGKKFAKKTKKRSK